MDNYTFVKRAKEAVAEYFNRRKEITDSGKLTENDVYIVWLCKTLQNNKALLSTTAPDGMYYEVTYNGDKNEMYLDAYKKWENVCLKEEKSEICTYQHTPEVV